MDQDDKQQTKYNQTQDTEDRDNESTPACNDSDTYLSDDNTGPIMEQADGIDQEAVVTDQDENIIDIKRRKRATICRQTIIRTTLFILTAAVVTTYKMKGGVRRTIDGLRHII